MQNNPKRELLKLSCNAKTRNGHPCKTYPVKGRKCCRMHGGTNNGAPKGNTNFFKHGYYTKDNIAKRSEVYRLIKECRAVQKHYSNNDSLIISSKKLK